MSRRAGSSSQSETGSWLIPLGYVVASFVLGLSLPRAEYFLLPEFVSTMSAPAAMAICGAVASGMIALTGIVFSLAFVMVQFSATAYSPRLVLWIARDAVMSHALGVFIATFVYALIMLGWVDRGNSGQVPLISSWMVLVLLLASMAMFLAVVQRIGFLKVSRMLVFTGNHGRRAIAEMYPAGGAGAVRADGEEFRAGGLTATLRHTGPPRSVQAVRVGRLVALAAEAGAVAEVAVAIGDSVLEMSPLLRVYGARGPVDERAWRRAIELGEERTFEQDPKYAIRVLVDIAIKALSPAINDPTTAVQALDQIEDLLSRLGRSHLETGHYRDVDGRLRVVMPRAAWEDYLRLGLDEIRFCGAESVQVMRRMMALIKGLLEVLPEERHAGLRHWEKRLAWTIRRSFEDTEERLDAAVADRQGLGHGEDTPAAGGGAAEAGGDEARVVPVVAGSQSIRSRS